MRSRNSSIDCKGLTLIELVVAIGLLSVVFSLGSFFGMDLYRAHVFRSDTLTFETLIRKARSQSMHRVHGLSHGVFVAADSTILFTGKSYASRNENLDVVFPRSARFSYAGLSEIVFAYDGRVEHPGTITVSDESRSVSFEINSEGGIDER